MSRNSGIRAGHGEVAASPEGDQRTVTGKAFEVDEAGGGVTWRTLIG